ncbi:MAG: inorganic phosphate transporter family protein [Acidimicrobiia bacterium]|nr:inorganic phosphate transporter [Acidimicrobiia bacterium]MCL4292103.1 inorganic phosphate transporter family protein [Acidimicrobiia bacterium]
METLLLWLVVAVALGFDYVNGFHDAANSIATIVSTRVLSPRWAVVWAATFNFVAFLVFGTHVADTIAKDVVLQDVLSIGVIFSGLVGAISLNLITFFLGLPTSSSHALVGGMAGAAVAKAGTHVLVVEGIRKIAVFIVLSPLLGLALAFVVFTVVMWVFHRSKKVDRLNRGFRRLQLVSAAAYSIGHGANDAQKTMGIILALLIAAGHLPKGADVPLWVVLAAHTAIAAGTLSGGWRIVKTMGSKITRLQPVGGFAAESAAAATLFFVSASGIPVSTTHTITGSIIGVGTAHRVSAVRWGVAGRVVWAWVLTIPIAAAIAAATYAVVAAF